jgi:hypothetical protein
MEIQYKKAKDIHINDMIFHIEREKSEIVSCLNQITINEKPTVILPFCVKEIKHHEDSLIEFSGNIHLNKFNENNKEFKITVPKEAALLVMSE